MIDINKPEVQNVLYSIVHSALLETGGGNTDVMPQEAKLDTATALIFDSVHAFAMALHELSSVQQVFLLVLLLIIGSSLLLDDWMILTL